VAIIEFNESSGLTGLTFTTSHEAQQKSWQQTGCCTPVFRPPRMNQRVHYTFYALCIIVSLFKKIMSAPPKKNIALTSGLALLLF
jgi:hypothetical protein